MRFHTIKDIFYRLTETKVLQNYSYMTILNVLSPLIGLIIYPYVIRTIGAAGYGLYAFLLAIATFWAALIDWGQDQPATKRIVEAGDDKIKTSQIICTVGAIKTTFFLLSIITAIPLVYSIAVLRANQLLFWILFAQGANVILFPEWYFQGKKNMAVVTWIQLAMRLLQIPLVLIFVHDANCVTTYALIVSSTILFGGTIATGMIFRDGIRLVCPNAQDIKCYLKDGVPFFLTAMIGTIKDKTLTTIIGAFIGMREVALYDLAWNKLVRIPRILTTSINSALYPEIVTNAPHERVNKVLRYERIIGLCSMLGVIVAGYPAAWIFGGQNMLEAYPLAVILSANIYTWLVVGGYLQFVFIPHGEYRWISWNQLIALVSCLGLCTLGLFWKQEVWIIASSLTISGFLEIAFCRIIRFKRKL